MSERNLPENKKRYLAKAARRLEELEQALEHLRKADSLVRAWQNRQCAVDDTTLLYLRTAERMVRVEVEDARRHIAAAEKASADSPAFGKGIALGSGQKMLGT